MSDIHLFFCDVCKHTTIACRDRNGYGQPTGPMRFLPHAGRQYGRPCKNGGELVPDEQPEIQPADGGAG